MRDEKLIDAIEIAKVAPEKLTAAQLAVIVKGAPALASWARDKHRRAHERDDDDAMRALYAPLGLDAAALKGLSKNEQLAQVIGAAIKRERELLVKRIDALDARVLELEADRAVRMEPVP
jgi:hypothetical protein